MRRKVSGGTDRRSATCAQHCARRLRTPPYLVFVLKGVLFSPFSVELGRLISLLQIPGW